MNDVREKLIELLGKVQDSGTIVIPTGQGERYEWVSNQKVADHLIANGVVVSKMETTTIATDNNVGDKKTPTAKDTNVPSKWIPVTERLPDKPGRYLICEEFGRVMIAGWDTSCWFGGHSYSEFTVYKATHWMPLPEPPKGE